MKRQTTSVLIVEDEPAIAELVSFTVKSAEWNPITVSSANDAWSLLQRQAPDMVLLDWMLPEQSGLHLLKRIRESRTLKSLPIIMLTAKTSEADKIEGLDQGADDYVTKPFSPRELTSRINALLRRKLPEQAQSVIRQGSIELDPTRRSVIIDQKRLDIGNTEFKLLKFFMAHPERVFTRSQLLAKIWNNYAELEERTVDVYVLRLRKALKRKGFLIKTIHGIGYMFSDKKE